MVEWVSHGIALWRLRLEGLGGEPFLSPRTKPSQARPFQVQCSPLLTASEANNYSILLSVVIIAGCVPSGWACQGICLYDSHHLSRAWVLCV